VVLEQNFGCRPVRQAIAAFFLVFVRGLAGERLRRDDMVAWFLLALDLTIPSRRRTWYRGCGQVDGPLTGWPVSRSYCDPCQGQTSVPLRTQP